MRHENAATLTYIIRNYTRFGKVYKKWVQLA